MRYLYMVIERDPQHAWLVVNSERLEIDLGDDGDFEQWARDQVKPPNVELKLLCRVFAQVDETTGTGGSSPSRASSPTDGC